MFQHFLITNLNPESYETYQILIAQQNTGTATPLLNMCAYWLYSYAL